MKGINLNTNPDQEVSPKQNLSKQSSDASKLKVLELAISNSTWLLHLQLKICEAIGTICSFK